MSALIRVAFCAAALAVFPDIGNAALVSRLGGVVVFDTDRNVTWLADAGLIGPLSWSDAQIQISALNSASYLGFDDWRMPTTVVPDLSCSSQVPPSAPNGYGCTGSEMGHLFYEELGGVAGRSILEVHNEQLALFKNIQTGTAAINRFYWSETPSPIPVESSPSGTGPYAFRFDVGAQDASNNPQSAYYTWLVRSGDVMPIPEPSTAVLAVLALSAMATTARRGR